MIEVELPDGRILEVQTDDPQAAAEAAKKLMGAQPTAAPVTGAKNVSAPPEEAQPEGLPPGFQRNITLGTQGAGKGMADLAGAPGDISTMIANTLLYALDKAGGAATKAGDFVVGEETMPDLGVDYRFPPSPVGSDAISGAVGDLVEQAGVPLVEPESMSPWEKAQYNINRFGSEAATSGAGLMRAATKAAPEMAKRGPRAIDALLRPYLSAPGKTVAADTAAGAGAGATLTAEREFLPEQYQSPVTDMLAMLFGAGGGAGVASAGRSTKQAGKAIVDRFPEPGMTPDPSSGLPVSRRTADRAARFMQERVAGDRQQVAEDLRSRVNEARANDEPLPTAGTATGDPGLMAVERGFRAKDPVPFEVRDQAAKDAAQEKITGLRDETANPEAATQEVARQVGEKRTQAQQAVDTAEAQAGTAGAARQAEGEALQANRGTAEAASEQIDEAVKATKGVDETRKKGLYDEARDKAKGTEIEGESLAADATAVRDEIGPLAEQDARLNNILDDLEKLAPKAGSEVDTGILDAAGKPIKKAPQAEKVSAADLIDMRPRLSSARDAARKLRRGDVVERLDRINSGIVDRLDTLADEGSEAALKWREAEANFKEDFAPKYREGVGGQLDKAERAKAPVRPTDVGRRFMTSKEGAEDLRRILKGSESEESGLQAARQWMLDQASAAVGADGKVNPNLLAKWRDSHKGALDQVPGLRSEIDEAVRAARGGKAAEDQFLSDLKAAQKKQKLTEQEIQKAATAVLLDEDPIKAAARVMSAGEFKGAQMMREIVADLKGNPEALKGWKRSVVEYLIDKVTTTNTALTGGAEGPVSIANLQKVFSQNKKALAEVFSPQEMRQLRRGHRILEPLGNRVRQATVGSPTAETTMLWNTLEAGLLAVTGNAITTGMVMKRIRVALKFLPDETKKVAHLVERSYFDPEAMDLLLTKNVKRIESPAYNKRLIQLLAGTEAGRKDAADED